MPRKKQRRAGDGRNQSRGASVKETQRFNVTLDARSLAMAKKLGDGNISLGIRNALAFISQI
jgi:hypothetical protein